MSVQANWTRSPSPAGIGEGPGGCDVAGGDVDSNNAADDVSGHLPGRPAQSGADIKDGSSRA